MKITKKSDLTGIEHTMEIPVTREQIHEWEGGTKIQIATPNLTASQREFLMTGITDEEWDDAFSADE
jgi:hypothetical protein